MKTFFVRLFLFAGLFFLFQVTHAQEFKPRQYKTFNRLGIEVSPVQNYTLQSVSTLQEILKKDRQTKVNKSIGIVFSVLSGISLGFGTYFLIENSANAGSGSDVMIGSVGTIFVATGGICAGVAVPLLIHAKKRRKQRERFIRSFKASYSPD